MMTLLEATAPGGPIPAGASPTCQARPRARRGGTRARAAAATRARKCACVVHPVLGDDERARYFVVALALLGDVSEPLVLSEVRTSARPRRPSVVAAR